jgi:transcriptional regulator with XRE-family HTH domain
MIDAAQVRAARALLDWKQVDLADNAGVGIATIRRLERSSGVFKGSAETLWKIQQALEAGGVEFLGLDGRSRGVRLKD